MARRLPRILLATLAAAFSVAPLTARAWPVAGASRCRIFPTNNHWNLRVDKLPRHPRSAAIVRTIGRSDHLHADFGSGLWEGARIGIPVTTVPGTQRKVPVRFTYASESDKGPYPIPKDIAIEGGRSSRGDRHAIIVDRDKCKLYELFAAYPRDGGARWRAGSGAIWDLNSNKLRPKTWTSADAAGLPILPGLARFSDMKKGEINHALRVTVSRSRRAFIYPARHFASDLRNRDLPAMGQRLRLKAGYNIARFPRQARIVLRALKRYGMIVADNGSDWYISGAPSPKWNNDVLHLLHQVEGRNFEVVDTSKLPRP